MCQTEKSVHSTAEKELYVRDRNILSFHRITPFLWMMEEKESKVLLSSAVVKSNYKINWTVLLMVPYLWGQAQQLQENNLPLQNKLTWLL
jgi:hypothetical protein